MESIWKRYFGKGNIEWKPLLIHLAIPLLTGGVSALVTKNAMAEFQSIDKPPLTPPGWLFPIAWTMLFVLMGLGSYIVWKSRSPLQRTALSLYGIQLFVNFFWSVLFFNLTSYLFAFFWLLLLLGLIITMFYYFYRAELLAAYLQIPYIIWVIFAGYLNMGVYLLNR